MRRTGVQYAGAVEPQRRLAPHAHFAIRGTIPRALVRQVAAATYHQVWWPPVDRRVYEPGNAPQWDPDAAGYTDPTTGRLLPSWDDALDLVDADPNAEPVHVVRFGSQVDAKGVLAGTADADRCVGYITKYLTKQAGRLPRRDHRSAAGAPGTGSGWSCGTRPVRSGARTGCSTASSPRKSGRG